MDETPRRIFETPRQMYVGGLNGTIWYHEDYAFERAPSHDGTLCYTAWPRRIPIDDTEKDPWGFDQQPDVSIQIYDTTPGSDNAEHLKSLAKMLHEESRVMREIHARDAYPDRIDVWGLPLAVGATDEERIERCKTHMMAEIASREAAGGEDWKISYLVGDATWRRFIIIIDKPMELWDKEQGGFLFVRWEWKRLHIPTVRYFGGDPEKEPKHEVERHTHIELDEQLILIRQLM